MNHKKDFESKLSELIKEYRDLMNIGDLVDSVFGFMTILTYVAARRMKQEDTVKDDLIWEIKSHIASAKDYIERHPEC